MWSFRKEAHKVSAIGAITPLSCGEEFSFTGTTGIYLFDIVLGTDTGIVYFNYEAYGVPDRFIVDYDSVDEIDSLYVGDSLTGNPPDFSGMVGTTYNNVPEKIWDGVQFISNGNTQNITVNQIDVAPFGQTAGEGTGQFVKSNVSPGVMSITIPAVLPGTAWFVSSTCPLQPIAASIVQDDFQEEGDTLCTTCATITVHLKSSVNVADATTDIDLGLNRMTITGHNLGVVGEIIAVNYSTTGSVMTYVSNLQTFDLSAVHVYQLEIIDVNTVEFVGLDINGIGTDTHTFTPVSQNKRVEFTLSGDVGGSYSDVLTLCPGGGTNITTDTIDPITATKTYQFGVDGIKEAGFDNFSNTVTVNVYDDDTNVLDDTYVLTRTHNNTSC